MYYDIEEQEIVVRLNNDEGVNENDIFINSFESELCEVQWVADSLYYLYPIGNKDQFENHEELTICKQLDNIIEVVEAKYDILWEYEDDENKIECIA